MPTVPGGRTVKCCSYPTGTAAMRRERQVRPVGEPGALVRRHFATDDPAVALDHVNRMVGPDIDLVPAPGAFRLAYRRTVAPGVIVDDLTFDGIGIVVSPVDAVVVMEVRSGVVDRRSGGARETVGAGGAFVQRAGGPPGHEMYHRATARGVVLDRSVIAGVQPGAAAATGSTVGDVMDPSRWTDDVLTDSQAVASWHRAASYAGTVLAADWAPHAPLVVGELGRLLAATAVALFAPGSTTGPVARPRPERAAALARVNQAASFLEEHARYDVDLLDVAAAASVSPAVLRLGFVRHLDTTPHDYLRRVRVHRAHEDLLFATPATTVARTAHRWGFAHPDRFAECYRHEFGDHPDSTLWSVLRGSAGRRS
ncbi:MAG: helix-turn-helix domain-containing protein [Phycicoccus sp.]